MAGGHTREFKVYEHGGRNTEICKQFTRKIEEKGSGKKTVRTDIPSFLYVHEVNRVFHDIKSALNSAGNINSYAAVVVFRKLTPNDKPDSSDLYSKPRPLGIPDGLPIVACYWFENDCKQQLCDCEENEKSVKKLVRLIKGEPQTERKNKMAHVQTREFKVYEHGGRNTEICEQFTRKIEEKGNCKVSVCTDIPSFLYVHEVNRVFHDIKSALNSAGNINSYAAVVIFRKLTPYEKPDSSDLYPRPWPLEIPDGLPIVACYWFENDCKQQLCDCEENKKSVKKLVRLIKGELQTDTDSGSPSSQSSWWTNFWNSAQHAFRSGTVGGQSYAPAREPPRPEQRPEPLLPNPWREVEFSDDAYKKLCEEITNHQPQASTRNILISDNVGSGKSSFLNSVLSELRREELNGRVQNIQAVRPGEETSVTQRVSV
ncbi:interferon-induced protein 44-like isoform X2 [Huso huso]|uniref:Interferon-induced protein 44-like isoform X2 n=1 Tax=Huso huso TaxID=61971 RepID=A0ABR0Y8P7_HUSHU